MIVSLFLWLFGFVLWLFNIIFGSIPFSLPANFISSVEYFFAQLKYADILIPVNTLMQALGVWLTFIATYYSVKIFMWIYHVIRHGGDSDLPVLGTYSQSLKSTEITKTGVSSNTGGRSSSWFNRTLIRKKR